MLKNKRYGMFLLAVLLSVCCVVLPAAAEPVSYDIAGRWLIQGEGYGEKRVRVQLAHRRSEERRVGKECRSRWSPYH